MNLLKRLEQWLCGLRGHDALPQFEKNRVYLKCFSCGFESSGWIIGDKKWGTVKPGTPANGRSTRLFA